MPPLYEFYKRVTDEELDGWEERLTFDWSGWHDRGGVDPFPKLQWPGPLDILRLIAEVRCAMTAWKTPPDGRVKPPKGTRWDGEWYANRLYGIDDEWGPNGGEPVWMRDYLKVVDRAEDT